MKKEKEIELLEIKNKKLEEKLYKLQKELYDIKSNNCECIEFNLGSNPKKDTSYRILSGGLQEIIDNNISMIKYRNKDFNNSSLWVVIDFKKLPYKKYILDCKNFKKEFIKLIL